MSEKIVKVKVSAGAKTEKFEKLGENSYKVRIQTPPEKGKANQRVAELLAMHFGVAKSQVSLLSGTSFREKTFLISTEWYN